ncbi:hypothetical protein ABZ260_15200 [Streptosporangium sp. NPDC006013]|uniref:hypothetical protein n=1 Tax=Streptosporangium sp. NPDC006013 TaxID=3155596 RepID=UPI0033B5ADF2
MNTTPGSDAPTNRRGSSPVSQAIAAAPPATTEQSAAVHRAEDLAAVLADVHNIVADVHELTSGNAIVSLRRGLLAYIVCAKSAGELWDLMQQTEVDLWRTSSHGATPPTPSAARRPDPPLPVVSGLVPRPHGLPPGRPRQAPRPRSPERRRP